MKFKSIKVRGLGPFADLVERDLTTLDGRLTAITGPNGSGKSTLLELLLGAVYRATPTRGSLVNLAGDHRDGLLEVVVETDAVYTLKHLVDGVSGKAEAVAIDANGKALTTTGKVTEFDAFIADHFPPISIALTTQFAAQKAGGFIEAKPSERKALLLRMLGVDQLEVLAGEAREHSREKRSRVEVCGHTLASAKSSPGLPIDEAKAGLTRSAARVVQETTALALATADLEAGREVHSQAEVIRVQREQDTANRNRIHDALNRMVLAKREIEHAAEQDAATLADGPGIDAAVLELDQLQTEGQQLATTSAAALARLEAVKSATATRRVKIEALNAQLSKAQRIAGLAEQVAKAAGELQWSTERRGVVAGLVSTLSAELTELGDATLADAGARIDTLREALAAIVDLGPSEGHRAVTHAHFTLEADDALVEAARLAPKQIAAKRESARELNAEAYKLDATIADARVMASRQQAVDEAAAEARQLIVTGNALQAEDTQHREELKRAQTEHLDAEESVKSVRAKYVRTKQVASRAPVLAAAQARSLHSHAALITNADLVEALNAELSGLVPPPEQPPPVDVAWLDKSERAARQAFQEAVDADKLAAHTLDASVEWGKRLDMAEREHAAAVEVLSDWERLARDLGKNGLQAAVVDAALPELIAITNGLLGDAFGPRFAVDIRSQSVSASGKKMVETLEVFVLDSERGREAKAETYSGGELTIISEGLSLALTSIACRQAGVTSPTIIRDEAGAALDEGRGRQWVAMLRQAAELIDADRVLFVSHDPGCRALADSAVAL